MSRHDSPPAVIRNACFDRKDRAIELPRRTPNPPFNRRAESYRDHAVVQRLLAEWLAEWLETPADLAQLTAVEMGAGDGLFTQFAAARCPQLLATDIAPRMVDLGRRHLPHVAWRVADAWRLGSEPVDRLYSSSLLHWCQEPAAVLKRWRRVFRSHGRMLHGFYVSPTLAEWHSIAGVQSPVAWRSPSQWRALFRGAGWRVVRAETREHMQNSSSIELLRVLHYTGAVPQRHTPVKELRRMIHEYERRFASPGSAPSVASTWTFFRIEAVME